jgi:hypothetical protein
MQKEQHSNTTTQEDSLFGRWQRFASIAWLRIAVFLG